MKLYYVLMLFFISFNVFSLPQGAVQYLMKPTLLLSQNRYGQAADQFHAKSILVLTQERKLGSKKMWELAGLFEGLAAMSAEKDSDPKAYDYWANSIKYFLMGGQSWEQSQRQIHAEYEQINTRLQASMAQPDTSASVDDNWLQVLSIIEIWDEKLNYFSFSGPSPGLRNNAEYQMEIPVSIPSQKKYKSHNSNSKLSFDGTFKKSASFVIKAEIEAATIPLSDPVLEKEKEKEKEVKADGVVIIGASLPEIQVYKETTLETKKEITPLQSNESESSKIVHRVNLDSGSTEGTSSIQQRTFTPESTTDK